MKHIALTGPTYSGKSTLARALEAAGYARVQFNDLLKLATVIGINHVLSLFGDQPPRVLVSLEEVIDNKAEWRVLLQEMGVHLNFDAGGVWIDQALGGWYAADKPALVLDCLRTPEQCRDVKAHGIQIVRLELTNIEQYRRAKAKGISLAAWRKQNAHPVEHMDLSQWVDLTLDATMPTEDQVRAVIQHGETVIEADPAAAADLAS